MARRLTCTTQGLGLLLWCVDDASATYLVESIELWSRGESLRVVCNDGLGGGGGVYDNDGNVSELDLEDVAVRLCPLLVLLGGVAAQVPQVADERQAWGAWEAWQAGIAANDLIDEDVDERQSGENSGQGLQRAFLEVVDDIEDQSWDGHSGDWRWQWQAVAVRVMDAR